MRKTGFDYNVDEEILRDYLERSLDLRLKWLYYGNKFRKGYPEEIGKTQERLRGNRNPSKLDR